MDINEVTGKEINRHPWELSRTQCMIREWLPVIRSLGEQCDFIDVGAGDMYFDKCLQKDVPGHVLHAVDIGYRTDKGELVKSDSGIIRMYGDIDELGNLRADYALMLDSIEYIPEEVPFLRELSSHVKNGGYLFFSMVAFQSLFSQHDVIVKLLRRYNRKEFRSIIEEVGGLSVVREHYFFFSLFLVRATQKFLHLTIDPDHKVTTGWKYGEKSFMTRFVTGVLKLDYAIGRGLSRIGIHLPGLSLMVVCRKAG